MSCVGVVETVILLKTALGLGDCLTRPLKSGVRFDLGYGITRSLLFSLGSIQLLLCTINIKLRDVYCGTSLRHHRGFILAATIQCKKKCDCNIGEFYLDSSSHTFCVFSSFVWRSAHGTPWQRRFSTPPRAHARCPIRAAGTSVYAA